MATPLSKDSRMECVRHGLRRPAFVCQHLYRGEGSGFHQPAEPPEEGWPFQNAWCDTCEAILDREGE